MVFTYCHGLPPYGTLNTEREECLVEMAGIGTRERTDERVAMGKRIVEDARRRQIDGHLSNTAFAAALGVSENLWVKLKAGQRGPGTKFLEGLARRYPEMTPDIRLFLGLNGSETAG